jgi:hypothetical protein
VSKAPPLILSTRLDSCLCRRRRINRRAQEDSRCVQILLRIHFHVLMGNASYDAGRSERNKQTEPCVVSPGIRGSNRLTRLTGDRLHESSRTWLSPPDPSENQVNARRGIRDGSAMWFTLGSTFGEWNAKGYLLWIHGKRTRFQISCSIPATEDYLLL